MSFANRQFRPPLANELFGDRDLFGEWMQKFPACLPIIPYLRRDGVDVEQELEGLREQAERGDLQRSCQLAAIRYYLHSMLWNCEVDWNAEARGVTNHRTLLDEVRHWRQDGERVCLVTFNYDRLIESALEVVGLEIRQLSDYISDPHYRLFKLHGSVNWGHEIEGRLAGIDVSNPYVTANAVIARFPELRITERYRIVENYPMSQDPVGGRGPILLPALTIPIQKKNEFECPSDHVKALEASIPDITKVLTVGWRGTEEHFLRLLAKNIQQPLSVMSVSQTDDTALGTIEAFRRAGIKIGDSWAAGGGFTVSVESRRVTELLRR